MKLIVFIAEREQLNFWSSTSHILDISAMEPSGENIEIISTKCRKEMMNLISDWDKFKSYSDVLGYDIDTLHNNLKIFEETVVSTCPFLLGILINIQLSQNDTVYINRNFEDGLLKVLKGEQLNSSEAKTIYRANISVETKETREQESLANTAKYLRAKQQTCGIIAQCISGWSKGNTKTPHMILIGLILKLGGASQTAISILSKMRLSVSNTTALNGLKQLAQSFHDKTKENAYMYRTDDYIQLIHSDNYNKQLYKDKMLVGEKYTSGIASYSLLSIAFRKPEYYNRDPNRERATPTAKIRDQGKII